jgi:NADH-quinone oxidoreductase subunit A
MIIEIEGWTGALCGTSMPASYTETYFPVLLQVIIAMMVAAGMIGASYILGKKVQNRVKDSPYECGIPPTGDARQRFSVKFYLVAMVFILFDVETVFLYPWAVVYRELRLFGFVEMLVFIILILSGFFYIWRKGALDWSVKQERPAAPSSESIRHDHAA